MSSTPMGFRVIALIATYNEEDIVAQVVADLIRQGVEVYLIDDGSTDGTVAQVEPFQGRGVVGIERLPHQDTSRWADLLRRKEDVARELDADWFLHQDADELRESPWEGLDLRAAIARVDRLGYNAIDFHVLDFWPTDDDWCAGADPRVAFTHWSPSRACDRLQVKAWKRTPAVELVESGGHEASFPGRQVFPVRFLARHYPIRSQAHGERKVFDERLPRLATEAEERGWHVQYQELRPGTRFVRDPSTLRLYDAEGVRLDLFLHSRGVEELEAVARLGADGAATARVAAAEEALVTVRGHAAEVARQLEARNREAAALHARLAAAEQEAADLHRRLAASENARADLRATLDGRQREMADLRSEVAALRRRVGELLASRSWRWTAPVRALLRRLGAG
ncbi:MAG TPA: glycosyltransferase [Thermoanaerobaculia bacterium]|nr:glycosyltransferase [Thermoanaerobaculia bacterium]